MTDIDSAVSILQHQQFALSGGPDDDRHNPGGLYYLSVARSTQSSFMNMMIGTGSVILVINKNRLRANNKVMPYRDPDAATEMGGLGFGTNEMEDRVYSNSPYLKITPPINNTILQVRVLVNNVETATALELVCKSHNIPFVALGEKDTQKFLMGR